MADTSRSRLNSVYALVDELSLRPGNEPHSGTSDPALSLWEKLHANGMNDMDAWLCGALMKRLALAASSPTCKSSDHIHIIGKLSESKQSIDADRVYIASAQCGALRQLHAVKPTVVQPHVNTAQFIPVVRQSTNIIDERKQREEVLKICRDVLISTNNFNEAESICLEFLDEDTIGIRAIAIDGLLKLASKRHLLPLSLFYTAQNLLKSDTLPPATRVSCLRLFRVIATQHSKSPDVVLDAISTLCLSARDRSSVIRREVTRALRFFPSVKTSQLLQKAAVQEKHSPKELMQAGLLLSLLEDQDAEVRCEASTTIVALCQSLQHEVSISAVENSIVAHADLLHTGTLSSKIHFALSLAALLRRYNQLMDGVTSFTFTTEQMEYILAEPDSAHQAAAVLSAITSCDLQVLPNVTRLVEYLAALSRHIETNQLVPKSVHKRLENLTMDIGRGNASLIRIDEKKLEHIKSLRSLSLVSVLYLSVTEVSDQAKPKRKVSKVFVSSPDIAQPQLLTNSSIACLLHDKDATLVHSLGSSAAQTDQDIPQNVFTREILELLAQVLRAKQVDGQTLATLTLASLSDVVQTLIVRFPSMPTKDVLQLSTIAQILVSMSSTNSIKTELVHAAQTHLNLPQDVINDTKAFQEAIHLMLQQWWPSEELVLHLVDKNATIMAKILEPWQSIEAYSSWTKQIPFRAIVHGVDTPSNLAIRLRCGGASTISVDVLPRDIDSLDHKMWLIKCKIPVTFLKDMYPILELCVCIKQSLSKDGSHLIAISPTIQIPVIITTSGQAPPPTPNMSPIHHSNGFP